MTLALHTHAQTYIPSLGNYVNYPVRVDLPMLHPPLAVWRFLLMLHSSLGSPYVSLLMLPSASAPLTFPSYAHPPSCVHACMYEHTHPLQYIRICTRHYVHTRIYAGVHT